MLIEFEHISKSFGANEVLKDVSFSVKSGQILALLGENGAGKSTLMNMLGGLLQPSNGQIAIDGKHVNFHSPNDSIAHGIAFIHQELNPVNDLRVYENMFLGMEQTKFHSWLKRDKMRQQARQVLDSMGIELDEQMYMRELDASYKQIVEISRALLCQSKIIIMDEPTTSLAEHEIALLFALVKKLASQGVAIIFISHKLNEVKELCTRYVVLRNGILVGDGDVAEITTEQLSEMIVGHELSIMQPEQVDCGNEMLRAEHLTLGRNFQDINFKVHAKEIVGFTGLLGDGRTELFRAIFGDLPDYSGQIYLNQQPFHAKSTAHAVESGIAYVPSNRKENAILPDMSVLANGTLATLKNFCSFLLLNINAQHDSFKKSAAELKIKYANENDAITVLSGGNQQKVVLTRWMNTNPKILILDNPTQGVDIGAKQDIYAIIRQIAKQGVAVIVLSGEGQEIVRLCHRTYVMCHGHIAGELTGDSLTEQEIMKYATGAISK